MPHLASIFALALLSLLVIPPAQAQGIDPSREPEVLEWGESIFAGVIPPLLPPHGLREAAKLAAAGAHEEVHLLCAPSITAGGVEEIPCRLLSGASLLSAGSPAEARELLLPARGRLGPLEPWGALFLAEAELELLAQEEGIGGEQGSNQDPDGAGGLSPPPPAGGGGGGGIDSDESTLDGGGSAAAKKVRIDEIAALLEEARAVDPSGPLGERAKLLQARLEVRLGDPREGLRLLQSLRPGSHLDARKLHLARAEASLAAGDEAAAIRRYRAIWKESAGLPAADEAARRLEAIAAAGKPIPAPTLGERLERIDALFSRGKAQLAYDELLLLEAGPGLSESRLIQLRAQALWDLDRKEESEALLAPYLEEDSALEPGIVSLGARLAMRRGDAAVAVARLDRIARGTGGRTSAEAAFLAAFFLYDDGRFEVAEERFRAFGAAHPGHRAEETRWYIAWTLFKQGRYREAASDLTRFIARSPNSSLLPQAMYWRARSLALDGEEEAAQEALREVAERWPEAWYGILAEERLRTAAAQPSAEADGGETGAPGASSEAEPAGPRGALDQGAAALDGDRGSAKADAQEVSQASAPAAASGEGGGAGSDADPAGVSGAMSEEVAKGPAGLRVPEPIVLQPPSGAEGGFARAEALYGCGLPHLAGAELDRALASNRSAGSRGLAFFAGLAIRSGDPSRAYQLGLFRLGGVPELAYPLAYDETVRAAARRYGVEPNLIWAIMRQESGFRRTIRSPADAVGLMQILPITAERLGALLEYPAPLEERLEDARINIALGAFYLSALLDRFGHPALAAAAYNAGPPAVASWLEDPSRSELPLDEFVDSIPFRETRAYVKLVMANLYAYRRIHGTGDVTPLELELPSPGSGIDF